MGSPEFAIPSLDTFYKHFGKQLSVITQPDKPKGRKQIMCPTAVKKYCIKHSIPYECPQNKDSLSHIINTLNPSCIAVVAYGKILPKTITDTWMCLNLHPSLLPLHRGPSPIQSAILNGEAKTGISIIKLIEAMDAGPIISQETYDITNNDDAESLHDSLAEKGAASLLKCTLDYLNKAPDFKLEPQDEFSATFCPLIKTANAQLHQNESLVQKWLKIRAYNPKPGAFILMNNQRIKIFKATLSNNELIPIEIQLEGKQRMTYEDYLKGGQAIAL